MSGETVYIGVEPSGGRKSISYAVLDARRDILQLASVPLEEAAAFILSHPSAVCAVGAPCGGNSGLMESPAYRSRIGLDPARSNYASFRVSEYELRRRGIYIYNTPADREQSPRWVQDGWELYDRLREGGFVDYPGSGSRRLLETYPPAAFTVLIEKRPYAKSSLEGLLQRQLILYEEGVDVPNPMMMLEELTSYRLRTGQLNLEDVHEQELLDALVAAYTAYLVDRAPEKCLAVGDPEEGYLVLPASSLKDSY